MVVEPTAAQQEAYVDALKKIQAVLGTGQFSRGEMASILAGLLAVVLSHRIEPHERVRMLADVVGLIQRIWLETDAETEARH